MDPVLTILAFAFGAYGAFSIGWFARGVAERGKAERLGERYAQEVGGSNPSPATKYSKAQAGLKLGHATRVTPARSAAGSVHWLPAAAADFNAGHAVAPVPKGGLNVQPSHLARHLRDPASRQAAAVEQYWMPLPALPEGWQF